MHRKTGEVRGSKASNRFRSPGRLEIGRSVIRPQGDYRYRVPDLTTYLGEDTDQVKDDLMNEYSVKH